MGKGETGGGEKGKRGDIQKIANLRTGKKRPSHAAGGKKKKPGDKEVGGWAKV